jgi:hypothetical protein
MSSPSLRCMVTALRSFLRFLHATGRVAASLVAAVPALKTWPRTALPSVLPASDARRLVAGCDPATARGLRDAAIVLVLLRLGLRASEVARLALDDIDWRAGEMTTKGKGGRSDQLPLPVEVGQAIAAYLRGGRPSSSSRSVFLTATAPIRPLSSDGVGSLVYRACARAGVGRVGPHADRLRLAATSRLSSRVSDASRAGGCDIEGSISKFCDGERRTERAMSRSPCPGKQSAWHPPWAACVPRTRVEPRHTMASQCPIDSDRRAPVPPGWSFGTASRPGRAARPASLGLGWQLIGQLVIDRRPARPANARPVYGAPISFITCPSTSRSHD